MKRVQNIIGYNQWPMNKDHVLFIDGWHGGMVGYLEHLDNSKIKFFV